MYDQAYIDYLAHFHGTRDYFECHELLEERWKEETPLDKQSLWVGLIQLSVSLYHYRRGNISGALRTLGKANDIIQAKQDHLESYGLDQERMLILLERLENKMNKGETYQSIQLPIIHDQLLSLVKKRCEELGSSYGVPSDLENKHLIHRHSMRDRTEVIEEREAELRKRKENH
ncbi:DUF309 domain-containing protein [Pontibacillus sp. HMF3514]|uniref:DUF309 domain-containing protein n=1 Tax=Pontibacillus sp. HMF3514 TaxID=2692425 RepID=UPI00132049B9|nr:DUF309 domain-containing protein [Pontibacillus sp. HMF3514]QHE52576.1 DUF309 domain-containing protein [Pontibacillus sp. HMF3514]